MFQPHFPKIDQQKFHSGEHYRIHCDEKQLLSTDNCVLIIHPSCDEEGALITSSQRAYIVNSTR